MQMPDELFKIVAELHSYYLRAIQHNEQAIAQMEAENIFFQAQLHHTDALIAGSRHQPEQTLTYEQVQINQTKLETNEAQSQNFHVNTWTSNPYQGLSMIDAISKVLEQHPKVALNAAEIGKQILPPHYSKERRAFLRGAMPAAGCAYAKELSRGAKVGRFDRAKERGYYICKADNLAKR